MLTCPICGQAFETGRTSWLLRCPGCGFERSTLAASISDGRSVRGHRRAGRAPNALNSLRERNFQTILEGRGQVARGRGRSARGWLRPRMVPASSGGGAEWDALGIEPDPDHSRGRPCRTAAGCGSGMFPQVLRVGGTVRRNRVSTTSSSHLPDVSRRTGAACADALQTGRAAGDQPS